MPDKKAASKPKAEPKAEYASKSQHAKLRAEFDAFKEQVARALNLPPDE